MRRLDWLRIVDWLEINYLRGTKRNDSDSMPCRSHWFEFPTSPISDTCEWHSDTSSQIRCIKEQVAQSE